MAAPKRRFVEIDRFYGLNENDTGQMSMKKGESPYMRNFRIGEDGKLAKRGGWKRLFDALDMPIDAMWTGTLAGEDTFLFAAGGDLYSLDTENGEYTLIGALDEGDAFMFRFGGRIYILAGGKYMSYDGHTLAEVDGYVPLLARGTPPDGTFTPLEAPNILTDKRRQLFSPDGEATTFMLCESDAVTIVYVKVNGESVPYTADPAGGAITFAEPPDAGVDTLEVCWRGSSDRTCITSMRAARAVGSDDTRVVMWGDISHPADFIWSETTADGPSAEYFVRESRKTAGSGEFEINDLLPRYDKSVLFTSEGAWYLTGGQKQRPDGTRFYDFSTLPLSEAVGLSLFLGGQLIDNDPVTVSGAGVFRWTQTKVRDECDASYISSRAAVTMASHGDVIATADEPYRGELFLFFGDGTCLIYNYRADVWYVFDGIPARVALTSRGKLYFASNDGSVCVFEDGLYRDDGVPFKAHWDMDFTGFGSRHLDKNLLRVYVCLEPQSRAAYELSWHTNRECSDARQPNIGGYAYFGYDSIDYGDFTYDTLYTPQTFRHRLLVKHFTFLKLEIENSDPDRACTLVSLTLEAYPSAETKE